MKITTTLSHYFQPLRQSVLLVFLFSLTFIPRLPAPPRDNYSLQKANKLSTQEAIDYLASMRTNTFAQSYVFRFKLKHYPYRGRVVTHYGTLYGKVDPKTGVQRERVLIEDRNPQIRRQFATINDFLLVRGQTPQVWVSDTPKKPLANDSPDTNTSSEINPTTRQLKNTELNAPILEGSSLTYFDLLAPFFYWNQYEYLGPEQVKARPTQSFLLYNPDSNNTVHSVALELDDEFRAILKATFVASDGTVVKSMELIAFKKTADTYIPKTLDYREQTDRGNKTRIDIIAAALDVENMPDSLFNPCALGSPIENLPPFIFDVF